MTSRESMTYIYNKDELYHWGILGQKWGIRRFQNADGSLTPEGRRRYQNADSSLTEEDKLRYKNTETAKTDVANYVKNNQKKNKFNKRKRR